IVTDADRAGTCSDAGNAMVLPVLVPPPRAGSLRPVPPPPAAGMLAGRRLDVRLTRLAVEQRNGAPGDFVTAREDLQHRLERRLEVDDAGERLADLEQRGQPPDLVGMIAGCADIYVGHQIVSYAFVG